MNKIGGLVRLTNEDEVQTHTPDLFDFFNINFINLYIYI
jgi:hypothetical protein